jgi:RND family efflux transporter MFP subunit
MPANITVALACVALLACTTPEAGAVDVAPAPKQVECARVQTALRKDTIEVRGTVAPLLDRDAQVAPQVAGRVLALHVHEGDVVAMGQPIARIDDAVFVDAARQAEAALARADAEYENAQTTLARVQRVFEHGIAPRQEVDDATARQAATQAARAEAESASRLAHRQIERAVVRSPLAGIVLKVFKRPGELVDGTPTTPIVEVADTSELELLADVPAQDLVRLSLHAQATIDFTALPGRAVSGAVSRVSPSVDRTTGVGAVRIGIARGARVVPLIGVFGVARVEGGEPHPVLLVPRAALRARAGSDAEVVVCGADHRAHARKVTVADDGDASVAVTGELGPDERVAVEPVLGLADSDPLVEAAP